MTKYSVKQLSNLAGVSVRTLHHYDQIGLLKPSFRSEKGYRFYERKELLLLQQILFYRKLGFSLKEIYAIINEPSFDLFEASKERYLGLGGMYIADQRFTDYYDKYKPGLAVFINSAIQVFCKNDLKIIKY